MPPTIPDLKPYKSLLLFGIPLSTPVTPMVNAILDQLSDTVTDLENRTMLTVANARAAGDMTVGFLHYVEERQPSWTEDPGTVDQINHLAFVARKARLVALFASDTKLKAEIRRAVLEGTGALADCQMIPPERLNAAFVEGVTRTLWLSGTHRRVTAKADSKILAGLDLRDSLDPIIDQSYYFSAARAIPNGLDAPIGTSPRKSAIWAGNSRSWKDFRDSVSGLLGHLASTTALSERPLPTLAAQTRDTSKVAGAFDISFESPELLADPGADSEDREDAERWAYRTFFAIDSPGPPIRATITHDGVLLGDVEIELDFGNADRIKSKVSGEAASGTTEELHKEALRHCRSSRWLKVRFDSGHTLVDGALFLARYRDVPFTKFRHVDLQGWQITQEKPSPITDVGNGQKSLFDWTYEFWPNLDGTHTLPAGWLASDDGSMEIADFIHLDETTHPPSISLIHVKGAGSDSPNRGISVSSYEVVTGQAVKNLRHLDSQYLAHELAAGIGNKISELVWHNGVRQADRQGMVTALSGLGVNYQKKVVILQPHVTQTGIVDARSASDSPRGMRLRQLDALLLSAEATFHGLGAEFQVVTAKE